MMSRRFFAISLSVLLTSCGGLPTQYMPNGYRYNDDTPLSSPAPSRPWMSSAEHPNLEHLGDNTAAWQGAVYELISPLPAILPAATTPLNLITTPPASPADASFDHYLRQGLLSYGYTVSPTPNPAGMTLVYNASPLSNPETLKTAQAKFGKEFIKKDNTKDQYYLTLDIQGAAGKAINSQSTIAILPYEKNEYMRWPGLSYQPTQGKPVSTPPVYETRD